MRLYNSLQLDLNLRLHKVENLKSKDFDLLYFRHDPKNTDLIVLKWYLVILMKYLTVVYDFFEMFLKE